MRPEACTTLQTSAIAGRNPSGQSVRSTAQLIHYIESGMNVTAVLHPSSLFSTSFINKKYELAGRQPYYRTGRKFHRTLNNETVSRTTDREPINTATTTAVRLDPSSESTTRRRIATPMAFFSESLCTCYMNGSSLLPTDVTDRTGWQSASLLATGTEPSLSSRSTRGPGIAWPGVTHE